LTDPSDISAIWDLKLTIRKYKYGLFNEIKTLVKDGEDAERELKERYEEPTSE